MSGRLDAFHGFQMRAESHAQPVQLLGILNAMLMTGTDYRQMTHD